MSEPEIARRCLACGAANRERTLFCPECGQELGQNAVDTDVSTQNETDAIPAGETFDLAEPDTSAPEPEEIQERSASSDSSPSDQTLSGQDDAVLVVQPLESGEADSPVAPQPDEELELPTRADSPRSKQAVSEGSDPASVAETFETSSVITPQPEKTKGRVKSFGSPRPAVTQGTRDKIHRATVAAREIEDDVLHKVEKIRKISTVVFDEAAYDPSVRFLLVAAALFALFLVIVVLNNLIS